MERFRVSQRPPCGSETTTIETTGTSADRRRPRAPWRMIGVAGLVLAPLVAPVGAPGGPGPVAAATTSLGLQGTINHTLGGVYPGAGPKDAYSSPAVADITGDAEPEIVVASMDGTVEAFRATDRTRLWT